MQECDVCVYHDYLPDYPPCSNCLSEHDVSGRFPLFCEALSEDVAFETKQTNGDRIRALTDEDLAVVIAWPYLASPPWCSEHTTCPYINEDPTPCDKCALDWLMQEGEA